jgi:hypothetical protein
MVNREVLSPGCYRRISGADAYTAVFSQVTAIIAVRVVSRDRIYYFPTPKGR